MVGGSYWYYSSQKAKHEAIKTAPVTRETIKETVSSSGVLAGKDNAVLKFISGGKLAYINVKAGDQVQKGDAIAGLDTKALSIALQQARNTWLAKDATAKSVEDELKDNDSDETIAQREERINAQTARDNAYDSVRAAERAFEDAVLYSPISGIVTQATVLAGQNVSGADTIAKIVDTSEIYLDAEVDEADIGKVKLGASSDVTLNSYPDQTFSGTVSQITPNTQKTDTGSTVVVVRIKLNDSSILFVDNINGQAEILVNQVTDVLAIPAEALIEEKYVFVKNGQNYDKTEVETGLSSDTMTEIKQGINEGQEVVTNPSEIEKK